MLKHGQGCSTACPRDEGVRARTSQPASPATRPGKGQTHGTPLTCPSAPLFIPGTCPHPCPSRRRSRKVLHFQEGPSLQSGAGQGSLIKQPLKQASLCPICLAEQKGPSGANPAPQGTILTYTLLSRGFLPLSSSTNKQTAPVPQH